MMTGRPKDTELKKFKLMLENGTPISVNLPDHDLSNQLA